MLEIGDAAPDFSLLDQNGNSVTLSSFLSSKFSFGFIQKRVLRLYKKDVVFVILQN